MTHVVYVDDEPALCRIFQLILRRFGATVHTFTDPMEALDFLGRTPVDAIVCDYRMPSMTGLDLLARLEVDVPFFMVSGELAIADLVADEPRVTDVLIKPFHPEKLLALLATIS